MHPRSPLFLCLCVALLGLAGASLRLRLDPLPVGDEATHVLMARSLWEEHDLVFDGRDLEQGYRIWHGGPAGVTLLTPDGGKSLVFAEPVAWALAAVPAWALFGAAGLPVLNMALFLAMLGAAAWLFREETGATGLFLGGFFFASAAFGYVFRGSPEVFLMGCVFFALVLWRRARTGTRTGRLALAGALLAAASLHQPALALLGLAVVADLALGRRWKGAAAMVLGGLLAFGVLAAGQRRLTGVWSPAQPREGVQRRSFETEFPVESAQDLWQAYGAGRPASEGAAGLRLLPRNLRDFLVGRHTGLLPYFPFALLALALPGPRDRSRLLLLAAVAAIVLLGLLLDPHRWHGGPGALGNARFAVLYPALLFLPGRLALRRSLAVPFAAVGLWTAAALAGGVFPGSLPAASSDLPAFRALPLELGLLGGGIQLPGYRLRSWGEAVWALPLATSWPEEGHPHGVWIRGDSTSDVIVISPQPLSTVRFFAHSLTGLAEDTELLADGGAGRVLVRFDSDAKRNGTPVDLALEPAARDLGILPGAKEEWVYRFRLRVSGGIIPARRLPGSRDPRYLGVFLDLTGEGL
jgi:hypothetical protein